MDKTTIAHLLSMDRWEVVDVMDNWLFIYDGLPKRMRIMVDLRIQGFSNIQIAVFCSCTVNHVQKQLRRAKKRFLQGENVL